MVSGPQSYHLGINRVDISAHSPRRAPRRVWNVPALPRKTFYTHFTAPCYWDKMSQREVPSGVASGPAAALSAVRGHMSTGYVAIVVQSLREDMG